MKRTDRKKCIPLCDRKTNSRRGSILVLSAAMLVMIFAFAAFVVDIGYIAVARNELQTAADSAACAGVIELGNGDYDHRVLAQQAALDLAELNSAELGEVLTPADMTFGAWDAETSTFTEGGSSPNAMKVVLRRASNNGNPIPLFFAPILGQEFADVSATAIAYVPSGDGPQFRFLLDDEMFDSDVPEIEDLADSLGVGSDDLISDGDGDGFIDIPGGSILELPTGQVGDEGMFDRTSYESAFPFTPDSDYTMLDFLAEGTALQDELGTQELQDVEWEWHNAPHRDLEGSKVLDPVTGVDPMDSHSDIMSLPNADTILLSPLFKSDASMAETDPSKYGSPAANLQGERRGLVAFKILSARYNPAGGSYLPLLTVEIIDPSTIDLSEVTLEGGESGGSGGPKLVQ